MNEERLPLTGPESTDAELLDGCRRGDEQAYAEVYRRFRPRALRFFLDRNCSRDEAEDLTHESFLKAVAAIPTVRSSVFLAGWLKKIAHNTYVDWLRKRVKERETASYDETDRDADGVARHTTTQGVRPTGGSFTGPDASARATERDECANLWKLARETLAPLEFQTLWLLYADGLEDEEIARSLGRSVASIRTAASRGRAKLRQLVKEKKLDRP